MCSTPKSIHTRDWHTSLDHVQTELTIAQYAAMARVQSKPKPQAKMAEALRPLPQSDAQSIKQAAQPLSQHWWWRLWHALV
ncbi:hypothetical protein [Balneatrix alpica]|uniref:Uncharacterized protein n=1 Tax=Balneatrix alpica TaxID=75684 RepID=A0ABV5ZA17_9GAMM|nr:hypothetical protein [Balneatrix alpica]